MQERLQGMTISVSAATSRTSFGFWIFFICFQILFAGAVYVFIRSRDEAAKKLM